jgi:hypothetical protein
MLCPGCEQIRTSATKEPLLTSCPVCGRSITAQYVKPFVEPEAFSVRIDKKRDGSARPRRSTLITQRQTLTHFIDTVEDENFEEAGLFRLALKEDGKLFRYNLGPQNKGFMLCPSCGASEPLSSYGGGKHKRLRAFAGEMKCQNEHPWMSSLAYGHKFESFCLIVRPVVMPASVESLAFALQKGLCSVLEIEPSDVGVSWRWTAKKGDSAGAEIVLYDRAPGGAGFARDARESWPRIVVRAHELCNKCTCNAACYDCLKDYGNQSHHEKLNRFVAGDYLNFG